MSPIGSNNFETKEFSPLDITATSTTSTVNRFPTHAQDEVTNRTALDSLSGSATQSTYQTEEPPVDESRWEEYNIGVMPVELQKRFLETLIAGLPPKEVGPALLPIKCSSKAMRQIAIQVQADYVNANPTPLKDFGILTPKKAIALAAEMKESLRNLNLTGMDIEDDDLRKIVEHCRNIEQIKICSDKISNVGLQSIASLENLQLLSLRSCSQITNEGLKHLERLSKLQEFSLLDCSQITDDGLAPLAALTNLQRLILSQCVQITNNGLKNLAPLTKLQYFSLHNSTQINDDGLAHLIPFTDLRYLSLFQCSQITETSLSIFSANRKNLYVRLN